MLPPNTVVHDLLDRSVLPSAVGDLLDALNRPVPHLRRAVKDLPQTLSWDEIQVSTWKQIIDGSPSVNEKLSDWLPIVLSQSKGIRFFVGIQDDNGPRHTRPLWHALVRILGTACHDEARTM